MSEKELNQLGLLEEFSITELEQRLEFEAWCDDCTCTDNCPDTTCTTNTVCPPVNGSCEPPPPPPPPNDPCIPEV
jgi:hypothetical protein